MIKGHGDDAYQYPKKVLHNFSSNVYNKGCAIGLLEEIKSKVFTVESYPSPIANELNAAAALYFGLSKDQFLFGNGATELFYLIAQLYAGGSATIVGPTFSEYEDACTMFQIKTQMVSWEQLPDCYTSDLVFICNPNNPTGTVLQPEQIEILIRNAPQSLFVIDEAYVEFTTATCSSLPLVEQYSNLVLVKSLTKTFTIPGIRLGYMVGKPEIIQRLLAYKLPWTVNALAIAAGLYIFKNYHKLLFSVVDLTIETQKFQAQINTISNLKVEDSATSYFLVEVLKGSAADLKRYLMMEHQILVRDATNFNLLEGEYIRLAVQKSSSNEALIKALEKWN
ncbi:pyridoxal phosphate-dependent aminotransferase [Flavobacterium sp. 7A]|uniref:pyridoxal phosphate-dependent aminotransferase n=1 Tax=Flavobacterium sp. 7A TaxID=2940571 RepID=UPI0022270388|nr:histidinol-phosphate transaminase [Flavobacterium sp. 7A]MCW2119669.1 threonine-phosphate decarboxylase [Flavobacterium sp. 7A]